MRFRYRHVHHTVAQYVETQLRALGWATAADVVDGDPVNFSTSAVIYLEFEPDDDGTEVKPNTIVITLGDEPAAVDQELGDGLREIKFPVFVDVYGASQAIAQSIASDAKRLFEDVQLIVKDFTNGGSGVNTTEVLVFDKDDVEVSRPPLSFAAQDFKRTWRVVKATANVQYIES